MNHNEYGIHLTPRGRRALLVAGIVIALAILFAWALTDIASAEAVEWDKSSIALDGRCLPDGSAEFSVTNTGRDMAGPSPWREYEADVLTQSGTFQLAAGATQVWTFGPLPGVPIRFEADQRPGHPGSSAPRLTLTCAHTTQTVSTACVGDKATVDWTAGNYWEKSLLLQVVMGGQATMVPLDNGQTTSGTFEIDLATLPAGEVWFVWADSGGSWTEKVAYEARSCGSPTALTLSSFQATSAGKRFGWPLRISR